MCSTCDYRKYDVVDETTVRSSLGLGNLEIRCCPDGKNYKIAVQGDEKSTFTIYRCPTCGRKLF